MLRTSIFPLLKKGVLLYLLLVALFIVGITVPALIPHSSVEPQILKSADILSSEGLYPVSFCNKYSVQTLLFTRDQYTDCLMLNLAAAQDETNPFSSAILSPCRKGNYGLDAMPDNLRVLAANPAAADTNYDWYWHGYLTFLKPLLIFFDYGQIRWLNCLLMLVLFIWTLVLIARRIGLAAMLMFLAASLMIHGEIIPFTMQFASVFFVTLISIIVLLSFPDFFSRNNYDLLTSFAIGAVTVYVDFLTAPIVSLGLPLLVWLLYRKDRQTLRNVVIFSLAWGMGYALLWASKWALCAMTYDPSVLENAALHADKWSSSDSTAGRMVMTMGVVKKYIALFWSMNWLWPTIVASVLLIFRHKSFPKMKENSWLLLIALMPFVWSLVLVNHNNVHFNFTCRMVIITLYALMLWVYRSVDWKRSY